jgi:hypothetical protein
MDDINELTGRKSVDSRKIELVGATLSIMLGHPKMPHDCDGGGGGRGRGDDDDDF